MNQNRIPARCPICGQWDEIPRATLGTETLCINCRQLVLLVPRSSRARAWRIVGAVILFLAAIAIAALIYNHRLNSNAAWWGPG